MERMLGGLLQENGLAFQDGEGFFETCNFRLTARFALGVGLRLGDAALLDALVILVHCIQLSLHTRAVSVGLSSGLIQALRLLGLVLDILPLGGGCDLVLLGYGLVLTDGGLLSSVHLCQTLCEVGFGDLEKT